MMVSPERVRSRSRAGARCRRAAAVAFLVPCVAAVAAGSANASSAGAQGTVVVVATGLNNPRGLAYQDGQLYVAEAGVGGGDCPHGAIGPEGSPLCVGRTGAVISISQTGHVRTLRAGLFSMSDIPGGIAATGVAAVAVAHHRIELVNSESVLGFLASLPHGAAIAAADASAARNELGRLRLLGPRPGADMTVADVGDADYVWTGVHQNLVPDQFPDANPNALFVEGHTTYVVDAASNTLDAVAHRGTVTQLAFLPNPAHSDAVPTCVTEGPGGDLYIGQLAPGAPLNGGNIYRYDVSTHRLSVWKTGFNVVDGCGFDQRGNFYATEFQAHGFNPGTSGNPAGDVVKIAPNGTRTTLGAGHLFYPQGFATDRDGHVYVSNWSILPGKPIHPGMPTGQVIQITTS